VWIVTVVFVFCSVSIKYHILGVLACLYLKYLDYYFNLLIVVIINRGMLPHDHLITCISRTLDLVL